MGKFLEAEKESNYLDTWLRLHDYTIVDSERKIYNKGYVLNEQEVSVIIDIRNEIVSIKVEKRTKDIRFEELHRYADWGDDFWVSGFIEALDIEIEKMIK